MVIKTKACQTFGIMTHFFNTVKQKNIYSMSGKIHSKNFNF